MALCWLEGGEAVGRKALGLALAERFQLAYAALRESDPQSENLAQDLMSLSDSIRNWTEISQGTKDRIECYLSQNSDLEVVFQKHLYIQGAKDFSVLSRPAPSEPEESPTEQFGIKME